MTAHPAVEQLADEMTGRLDDFVALGLVQCDPLDRVMASQIAAGTQMIVGQLVQEDDDRLSARTAMDVMMALWPTARPEDSGHAEWWATPLGRLCARALAHETADALTYSTAALMLGVARGTVSQMMRRGNLDRHPDGGVLASSVLARLGRDESTARQRNRTAMSETGEQQ